MARAYRLGFTRRLTNRMVAGLVRLGIGPRSNHLLTVVGRESGRPMTLR